MSTSEQLDIGHQPSWKAKNSENYTIYHLNNADVAARIALIAEDLRVQLYARWAPSKQPQPWRPRCQIMIYPSNADLVRMTGGTPKGGSAATRKSQLRKGTLLSTQIHLAADDRNLTASTLPHEITHIIAGTLLGGMVPLWANEGMATLAESASSQQSRKRIARWAVRHGRAIEVNTLMRLNHYPAGLEQVFYAQSHSLTRFLVIKAGFARFISFIQRGQQVGGDTALQEQYGLNAQQLEQVWKKTISGRK